MINSRALLISFLLMLSFAVITVNLFNIQVLDHPRFSELAKKQQERTIPVKAERGLIKDRNGNMLAYTQDDISFFVDTKMLKKKKPGAAKTIAKKFSEVFGKNELHYLNLLSSADGNVYLERKVPREKLKYFKNFILDELVSIEDPTRVYNHHSLAAHVIGYVNSELVGLDGVERVYDEHLKGQDGLLYVEKDVKGRVLSIKEEISQKPIPGDDLYLTLDAKYQRILEEELKTGAENSGAESGVGILMNPNTGEIIALANYPSFEPSKYFKYNDIVRRNRALTDTYEPGSTMKALTMSILLDDDLVREDELIDTENGRYKVSNAKIIDVNKFEKLTVREVLEQSSNVGITKLSERIDERTFYKYLRDFGFGNATSVGLPSEADGYLKKPDYYSKLSKPFMSFGYEISVTPLQMVTAFSALVNGGVLFQPRLIDKIVDESGRVIEKFESTKIRNVISAETSERIKNLLFGVVEHGTGKLARCNNMLVGGKTGTSQKYVDGEYVKDYNASFIGFFPADNPEVVGLILLSSPATGKYGGVIAAPVFKKIVNRIVEEDIRVSPQKITVAREEESLNKILESITNSEEPVFLQTANIGNEVPHIENVAEYRSRITMPNLMNRSLREALAILNEMGLRYDVNGSGRVVSQSIKAGSEISRGSVCLIECEATNTLTTLGIY